MASHLSKVCIVILGTVSCGPSSSADTYPAALQGSWGGRAEYAGHDSPSAAKKACASYAKDPAAVDGDVIVFEGTRMRSYGGYADYVDDNVSVKQTAPNSWRIVDRHYQDEEGGRKPGLRRVSYEATIVGDVLTVRRGKDVSRYSKCLQAIDIMPLKRGFYVQSNIRCDEASNASLELFLGDRFRISCKVVNVRKIKSEFEVKAACMERGETIRATTHYIIHSSEQFTARAITQFGSGKPTRYRYCPQSSLPEPWRTNRIPALNQNPAGQ